jgi:hypothetical protein
MEPVNFMLAGLAIFAIVAAVVFKYLERKENAKR